MYDYSRQMSKSFTDGPYLIMYAAGYEDNRPQVAVSGRPLRQGRDDLPGLGGGPSVADRLASAPATPHCPGSPGC